MSTMNRHRRVLVLLLLALPMNVRSQAPAKRPVVTTLCEVVNHPKRFQRRLVQFPAHYESDAFEFASLADDDHCYFRIAAYIPRQLDQEVDLSRRIWIGQPGTHDKVVSATWVGVFRWHPNQVPRMTLDVRSIKDLRITCEGCPGFDKPIELDKAN